MQEKRGEINVIDQTGSIKISPLQLADDQKLTVSNRGHGWFIRSEQGI